MSKERELLKKWLIECMWRAVNTSLLEETKELLAQPEPKQEPVAWQLVANFITDGDILQYTYSKPRDELYEYYRVTPLYTSPPTREGLTPREGLTEYKKGYARGFDVARKDYKQKVINAFGSEDE